MENLNKLSLIISFSILGIAIFFSSFVIGSYIYKIKISDEDLIVTGSARKRVVSDLIKWRSEFSLSVSQENLENAYRRMKDYEEHVYKFFYDNGIKENEMNITPVRVDKLYSYEGGVSIVRGYNLVQIVEINSNELNKVRNIIKKIEDLAAKDEEISFSSLSVEYYYSKLPEARIDLIGPAIQDAKNRAEKIVSALGKKVHSVRNVQLGVVQVLSPNSVEISDYGTYDTSSLEKDIYLTVKVRFRLK